MNIENVTSKVNADVINLMVKLGDWGCFNGLDETSKEQIQDDIKRIAANAILHYNNEIQDYPALAYKAILKS